MQKIYLLAIFSWGVIFVSCFGSEDKAVNRTTGLEQFTALWNVDNVSKSVTPIFMTRNASSFNASGTPIFPPTQSQKSGRINVTHLKPFSQWTDMLHASLKPQITPTDMERRTSETVSIRPSQASPRNVSKSSDKKTSKEPSEDHQPIWIIPGVYVPNILPVISLFFEHVDLLQFPWDLVEPHKDTLEMLLQGHQHLQIAQMSSSIVNKECNFLSFNRIRWIREEDIPEMKKLHTIYMDYNEIEQIDRGVWQKLPALKTLSLRHNHLKEVPHFTSMNLRTLDLAANRIELIRPFSLAKLTNLSDLYLQDNKIDTLYEDVFEEVVNLEKFNLDYNPLVYIKPEALRWMRNVRLLSLKGSLLTEFPEGILEKLEVLDLYRSSRLWQLPTAENFPSLHHIIVPFAPMCCAFEGAPPPIQQDVEYKSCLDHTIDGQDLVQGNQVTGGKSGWTNNELSKGLDKSQKPKFSRSQGKRIKKALSITLSPGQDLEKLFGIKGNETESTGHQPPIPFQNVEKDSPFWQLMEEYNGKPDEVPRCGSIQAKPVFSMRSTVTCLPRRNLFTPCGYLLGPAPLRIIAWVASVLALLGNALMLLVMCVQGGELTSYRFFLFNLGLANTLMASYVIIVSCIDIATGGRHYEFARHWQYGPGCVSTGFLAVYGSQITVLSLVGITIERYSLILHAVDHDVDFFVTFSRVWVVISHAYGLLMAFLPMAGKAGSYNRMAICLPVETYKRSSLAYFIILAIVNIGSFLFVSTAYMRIFWKVRQTGIEAGLRREYSLAKRIVLILICHFAAWVPLILIGLMEMVYPGSMRNFHVGRYIVVIFMPMNAFISPFLYVLCTKLFRREVRRTLEVLCLCRGGPFRYFSWYRFAPNSVLRTLEAFRAFRQRFRDGIFAARVEMQINPLPRPQINQLGSSTLAGGAEAEEDQFLRDLVERLDELKELETQDHLDSLSKASDEFSPIWDSAFPDHPPVPSSFLSSSPDFTIPVPFEDHASILTDGDSESRTDSRSTFSQDDLDEATTIQPDVVSSNMKQSNGEVIYSTIRRGFKIKDLKAPSYCPEMEDKEKPVLDKAYAEKLADIGDEIDPIPLWYHETPV